MRHTRVTQLSATKDSARSITGALGTVQDRRERLGQGSVPIGDGKGTY
jgi:hypothetical protein